MKLEDISKFNLGVYPTPLEKMNNLSAHFGKGDLFIKRDDTTGPSLGGNKTRKLEYLLHDAISKGYTAVLTVGGPQTNHGRMTASAAIKLGLKPILVLMGKPQAYFSGNLALIAMMGVDIVFDNGKHEETVADTIRRYESSNEKVYFIPAGGSDNIGALGYIHAVKELLVQMDALDIHSKYLVCSLGSMGTFGGLCIGARYFGAPFRVIGVPVAPQDNGIFKRAADYLNRVCSHYELNITFIPDDMQIMNGPENDFYSGNAYNVPDPKTRRAMFLLAKTEGIILDPVYTGKAFRGFCDMLKTGVIEPDSKPIFLHSGGAMAVWTKEHLDDMQAELNSNCNIGAYQGN